MIKLYSEDDNYKLYHGSMLEMEDVLSPNSIDAIITDPPYEINFMNKGWDNSGIAFQKEAWRKCFNVLKPGGYLLAFGGSRTFHRIACAIEDAGFEIRDTIMWLYGSGFPKSMSVSKGIEAREKLGNAGTRNKRKIEQLCDTEEYTIKQPNAGVMGEIKEWTRKEYIPSTDLAKQWQGWGTCLKPSYEPIIVARKPFEGSLVDNVIEYGVGGLNIDGCRVMATDLENCYRKPTEYKDVSVRVPKNTSKMRGSVTDDYLKGRFPANTILTYDDTDYEDVCENMADSSRYFYCAKASTKDRDEGLDEFEMKTAGERTQRKDGSRGINAYAGATSPARNFHPTVKPVELMQYLIRLVSPKGSTILDCFNGSGSTGKAVMYENGERGSDYKYIGIELTEEYLPISEARIKYAIQKSQQTKLF